MQKYKIEIEGVTPYMQHQMHDEVLDEWEKKRGFIIERKDVAEEDLKRAEYHAYINSKGKCYIPSEHIRGSMINAGGYVKSKVGNKAKSMKNIVAAMFFISPEEILIGEDFVIDKRSAVNRNIKARVISIRPKWEKWKASFVLSVDNDTITKETIVTIIEYAGQYVGIGSFRPTANGYFGRYKLNSIEKID
jgi:hypothetical protein